ncbi:SMC-Scp complex subunit ScpB [Candidatus Bathyarchaeota archaeon]|nr:SMC-Scp complex subunit ScpB [Candidatus Bathyarchaeota archaeon]
MTQNELKESKEITQVKFSHQLALLEAALYVSGRPLDLKTLGNASGTRSKRKALKLAKVLVEKYKNSETALEILEVEGERFVMQLKPEYIGKVRKLATRPLLSAGPLKTLSYIAFRQPIFQTLVVEVRGHHSYGHLKQLEEMELIIREGNGKKRVIRTTQFFADYFGLSHELRIMKRQLKTLFKEVEKPEEDPKKSEAI